MNVPASMKALKPYLQHAKQTQKVDPLVSYYCKYYAATLGIDKAPTEQADKAFLMTLLDELDAEKQQLRDQLSQPDNKAPHLLRFANKIFDKADAEDRAGLASKATGRTFYAASIFLNTLRQFGELDEEVAERLKYSKWKAADITTALREGRVPQPGPAGGEEDLDLLEEPQPGTGYADPEMKMNQSTQAGGGAGYPEPAQPAGSTFNFEKSAPPPSYSNPGMAAAAAEVDAYQMPTEGSGSFGGAPAGASSFSFGGQGQEEERFAPSSFSFSGQYEGTPLSEDDFPEPPSTSHEARGAAVAGGLNFMPPAFSPQGSQPQQYQAGSCEPTSVVPEMYQYQPPAPETFQVPPQSQQAQQNQQPQPNQQFSQPPQQAYQTPQNSQPPQQYQQPAQVQQQYAPQQQQQQFARAPMGPVPVNRGAPDVSAAYRFARFSVSALQFEDVPTAIHNLKLALGQLGRSID